MKDAVAKNVGIFDTFASMPTSGLVFGSALPHEMVKPFVYVRKESKGYDTSKLDGRAPAIRLQSGNCR